jgi:TonB family protein
MNREVLKEDWTGLVIDDKFPLLEWLGGTGQSGVFRTETAGPGSAKAAIRLIRTDAAAAKAQLAAWELGAGLSHPNLMRVLASGRIPDQQGDLVYVVTEFAEESLAQIIPQRALTPIEVKEMVPPVVDALGYLHGRGLVYRELRPSNVLVVDNQIKLPVEGIVRAGTLDSAARAPRIYDAPEFGTLNASPTADAWSLGVTIIEALTQKPPAWNRSSNTDPAIPSTLPSPFAEIAGRCLRRDPARRLTVGQVKAVLGGAALPPEPASETKAAKASAVVPANLPPKGTSNAPAAPANAVRTAPPASPTPTMSARPANLASAPSREERHANSSKQRLWILIGIVVVVVVIIALAVAHSHKDTPSASTAPQTPPASGATTPAAAPAPVPTASAAATSGSSHGDVLDRVQPDIPERAMHTIHGRIEITARLHVDENGSVTSATLERRGSSHYFASRALDAARNWKFKAPVQDGHALPSEWNLRFEFRHDGVNMTATQMRP